MRNTSELYILEQYGIRHVVKRCERDIDDAEAIGARNANYLGSGYALCGILKAGETLKEFINRISNKKRVNRVFNREKPYKRRPMKLKVENTINLEGELNKLAKLLEVTPELIKSKTRNREIVNYRVLFTYIIEKLRDEGRHNLTYSEIGRFLCSKHDTYLYYLGKLNDFLDSNDRNFLTLLNKIQ